MTHNRKVMIPAILIAILSIALIVYAQFTAPQKGPRGEHRPPAGTEQQQQQQFQKFREGGKKEGNEAFTLLGNIAIGCGAVSFWWFRFKKKLTSPSQFVKKAAKLVYKVHTYLGWAAVALVTVHGVYYLLTDLQNNKIKTGLAAFALMLTLAVYGWLMKRFRNKFMRTTHLMMSLLWIVAIFIHGGGFVVAATAITVFVFAAIWYLESKATKAATA